MLYYPYFYENPSIWRINLYKYNLYKLQSNRNQIRMSKKKRDEANGDCLAINT